MLSTMRTIGVFGFYAGLNILAFCLILLWVPETKQRTLEELDYIFAVPSRVFLKYQFTHAIPYWIKRWVLFQRSARLEPLYRFQLEGHLDNGTSTPPGPVVDAGQDKKSAAWSGQPGHRSPAAPPSEKLVATGLEKL